MAALHTPEFWVAIVRVLPAAHVCTVESCHLELKDDLQKKAEPLAMTGGGGRAWVVLGMRARAHLLPVLVHGRAANQCVSISFLVGAEQAAEATKR